MSSSEEDAFQDAYVAVGSLESERFFDATPGSWAEEKGPAHHLVSDRERFPHYEGNKSEVNRFPIDFIDNVHGGETSRDEDDDGDEDKNENCPREGRTLTNKIAPIETSSETSERDGFYSDIALLSEEVDKYSDESPRPRSQVIRGADTKVIHGPEETDGRVKEQLCEVSDPEDTNSRFIVDSSDSVIPQLDADSARLVAGVLQTDGHLVDDVDSVARAGRVTDGLGHAERIDPKQNDDDLKPSNVSESKIVSPSSTNVFPGFSEKKENAVKPDDSDSVRSPQIEEQQRFDSKSSPGSIASSESETAIGSNGESCESSQSAQQASSDEEFHYNMSENELNTFRDEDDLLHTAGDTCATHSLRVSGVLNKGSNSTEAAQTRAYNTNNDVAPDSSSQRKHLRSKETEQLGCLPEVPQPRHILSSLPSPCTNSTHKDSRDNSVSKTRPSISGITDESAFAQKAPKNPSTKLLHSPTLIRYDSPMVDEQAPPTQPSGSITPSVTSEHSANVPVVTAAARGMKNDVIKVGASTQQSMERVHATSSEDNSYGVVDDERTPLLCSRNEIKVYRRRWYVLFLFCLSALLQGLNWGTWGPITQSLKAAFDWTDGSVARLALVGNTSYVIFSVPVCLMVERKGMRVSMLVSMVLLTAGFSCPCVSSDQTVFTWMTTFGQVLVAWGAIVPFSAVSLLSSLWFPMSQRTTATSLATLFGYAGVAAGFIIGPLVVPEPRFDHSNITNGPSSLDMLGENAYLTSGGNCTNVKEVTDAIMTYLYYEAGANGLVLLLVFIYFPAKPPTPPSLTAHFERLNFREGIKNLFRNRQFLLTLAAYSIATGMYGAFGIFIDIDLQPLGISQQTAGWMGFYATIAGCIAGILFSRLSDIFTRKLKMLLLVMLIPTTGIFVWFGLMVAQYIPHDDASLYVTVIVPGLFLYGSSPLFYELSCEAAYPAGEGITTLVLTVCNNLIGIIFLGILQIEGLGVLWMNWLLIASMAASVVILLMTRVHYRRTNIDLEIVVEPPETAPAERLQA